MLLRSDHARAGAPGRASDETWSSREEVPLVINGVVSWRQELVQE